MNLVNQLIYYYMVLNLVLFLLLSLPLPSRVQRLFLVLLNFLKFLISLLNSMLLRNNV